MGRSRKHGNIFIGKTPHGTHQPFCLNCRAMIKCKVSQPEELESAFFECQTNPPQRILVADDDDEIRRLNVEVLTDSGYDVDAVKDGAAAWDALQLNSYDLLITDNNMPKMSGVELLKKLQAARMTLPIILSCAIKTAEELKQHPWLQINATLHKPYSLAKLLGTVGNVLHTTHGIRMQIAPPPSWSSEPLPNRLRL